MKTPAASKSALPRNMKTLYAVRAIPLQSIWFGHASIRCIAGPQGPMNGRKLRFGIALDSATSPMLAQCSHERCSSRAGFLRPRSMPAFEAGAVAVASYPTGRAKKIILTLAEGDSSSIIWCSVASPRISPPQHARCPWCLRQRLPLRKEATNRKPSSKRRARCSRSPTEPFG